MEIKGFEVFRADTLTELAGKIGLSLTALSLFKTGKLKGVRFASLNSICAILDCQPGDILEYVPDIEEGTTEKGGTP